MASQKQPQRKDSDVSEKSDSGGGDPYASADYQEALEDVHTRFILNLPPSELETADRLFFQLEQAWWFYEDWICDPHPEKVLPRFSSFKPFAQKMFAYSEMLPESHKFGSMWAEFSQYKRGISNYGCILLSVDYTKVILCQVWNGKTFTFPAGKINQGEDGLTAAARETYEETGFDPNCVFGQTASWKATDPAKITWKSLQEQDALIFQEDNGKRRTCYVCHGVPEDFPFLPVARKEVAKVAWYRVDKIPKSSYAVFPFLSQLRRWIAQRTKSSRDKSTGRSNARKKGTPKRSGNNSRGRDSRGKVRDGDGLVTSGLAAPGEVSRWSEDDMFAVNERLLGRKITYDGNPHLFEQGFQGQDPHAFHVVGGSFLNTNDSTLAPPPATSKLQPLFRGSNNDTGKDELLPFFSDDGATPWGETVEDAKGALPPRALKDDADALLALLQQTKDPPKSLLTTGNDVDVAFLTDAEVTARSNETKTTDRRVTMRAQYEADMEFIREWVANLPKPGPSKHFGTFKLDADAIMANALASVSK
jgi:mRNA-decapping enzyme subunit 2